MNVSILRTAVMGRGKGYRSFPLRHIEHPTPRLFAFKASPGLVQVPVSALDYLTLGTNSGIMRRDVLKSEIRKVIATSRSYP